MRHTAYAIVTTLLTALGLVCLFALRFLGVYNHQALGLVLLLGLGWAVVSRVRLLRKGRLHRELLRGLRERERRPQLLQAVGRASFWAAAVGGNDAASHRGYSIVPLWEPFYSASGCGRIWKRTISLVIPLPPSWCQFVTES